MPLVQICLLKLNQSKNKGKDAELTLNNREVNLR